MKTPIEDKRNPKTILYVGLDVHKESIAVAVAETTGQREVRSHGSMSHDLHAVEKLMRKLQGSGHELRVCYEAGPCGFGLARRLLQLKIDCQVIAPSLIPKKSGDRQKNDRRDAVKLARLHRAGELTAVHIPEPTDEALRDLCRARAAAMNDQRRTRQQLKAQLACKDCNAKRHGLPLSSTVGKPALRVARALSLVAKSDCRIATGGKVKIHHDCRRTSGVCACLHKVC